MDKLKAECGLVENKKVEAATVGKPSREVTAIA